MQDSDNNEVTACQPVKHDMGAMHNAAVPASYLVATPARFPVSRQADKALMQAVDVTLHLPVTPMVECIGGYVDNIRLRPGRNDNAQHELLAFAHSGPSLVLDDFRLPGDRCAALLPFANEPLQGAELDLSIRFPFLKNTKRFADDFAGVVIVTGLHLRLHEAFEFWRQRNVHAVTMLNFANV
jgi:hypothetical protein